MTPYGLDDRIAENRAVWTDFWKTFTIERFGITLTIIALFVIVAGYINQHDMLALTHIFGDFYANVSSELISIVITVIVFDRLNTRRQNAQELTRLKALMGSNESVVTKIAIAELKAKGWLGDGSLKGASLLNANLSSTNLTGVNLSGAKLIYADLSGVKLGGANLSGAVLTKANLSGAVLWLSNLSGTVLQGANLSGAMLHRANLTGVNLSGAKLQGANLTGVNLADTNIQNAECNEETILPDGTKWTSDVDWSKF